MPINIESVKFRDEIVDPTAGYIDYLLGNMMDEMRIEIDFNVQLQAISSQSTPFILNDTNGNIGTGWVSCAVDAFGEFEIGDTLKWYDYTTSTHQGTFVVVQKPSNKLMQLDLTVGTNGNDFEDITSIFVCEKDMTGIRFAWGMIENNDGISFISQVDGSYQEVVIDNMPATNMSLQSMTFQGGKAYRTFGASIVGLGNTTGMQYARRYKLVQGFLINPFVLADQYSNTDAGIAPSYFLNNNCLKYVFKLTSLKNLNNPNLKVEYIYFGKTGNTGWLNENYNNKPSEYKVDSVVYKDDTSTVIPSMELTADTQTVEITISKTGSAFTTHAGSDVGNPFVLKFLRTPDDPAIYQNQAQDLFDNFNISGAVSNVGDTDTFNYGAGGRKVINTVNSILVDPTHIKITANILMGSTIINELKSANRKSYLITVAIASEDATLVNSDKTTLLIDSNEFYINNNVPGLATFTNVFYRHYETDVDVGITELNVCPEDEVCAYTSLKVDRSTTLADAVQITSITCKIKAKNSVTNAEFDLDAFTQSFQGLPVINNQQFINLAIDRPYNIPASEIRKQIKFKTRTDLQAGNNYYFDIYFPFMVRWEYWKVLAGVNQAFFNTSEPNNGFNHFWDRYSGVANWGHYYEVIVNVTINGLPAAYKSEVLFQSNNYEEPLTYDPETIKAYDHATNVLLFDAVNSKNFFYADKETRLEAEFTYAGSSTACVVWHMELFEEGGIEGAVRFSTHMPMTSGTWFKSVNNNGLATLTYPTGKVKSTCLLDFSNIPDKQKFAISARLFIFDETFVKLTEDGTPKLTEATGFYKIPE